MTTPREQHLKEQARAALNVKAAPGWKRRALCLGVGPELFFPQKGDPTSIPKQVCNHCPVKLECLRMGIYQGYGIWGGTSERERRIMRRLLGVVVDD